MYKEGHAISRQGRQGEVHLADGSLTLDMRETTPEDLYSMAYAACYWSALKGVLEGRGIETDHRVEVIAGVDVDQEDRPLYVKVLVAFEDLDQKTAERLATYGDKVCRYSTAVEGNIEKTVEVIDF